MVGSEVYYLSEDVNRFEKELFHFYIDKDHFYGVQKKWIVAENNLLEAAQGTDYLLYVQRIQEYSPALDVIYMQHDFFALMHGLLLQKSDIVNADSLMDLLNLPLRLNYYRQEEYDLVLTDDLESHVQKYKWLSAKYGSKDEYTLEDAKAKKKNINQTEYLQGFHLHQEKVSQAILKAKSLLGEKHEHLVDLMQWLVWFRTQRTDVIARATYLFRPGYERLAQEFDVSYDDILSMSTRETLEHTLPSQAELQNRKKSYVFYINRDKQYIFTQDECLKAQEFMREDIQDTTQVI